MLVSEPGVLGADGGIIEAGGDGMRCGDLATATSSFDADHLYIRVAKELMEKADGVRTAADASKKMRGQALFRGEDLFAGFAADDGLKIADHRRVRMRAQNGAEEIVGAADVGDPVAHGFVDGVF